MLQDLRFAVRSLLRTPGFTVVAVLTLALGIGANTAIFSVLYGVLLRPLPYEAPDRLVGLQQVYQGGRDQMSVTWLQYRFLAEQNQVFESFAASTPLGMNLFAAGSAERVDAVRVSRDYFHTLGVEPLLGRTFTTDEDAPGGAAVVMLSHDIWRRRFASDGGVIGSSVSLDGKPYTVVGVMPASFRGLPEAEVWSTLAQVGPTVGSGQNLSVVARLKPGLELEQARAGLVPTASAFAVEFARIWSKDASMDLVPLHQQVVADASGPIRLLFGAIGFVLLIACVNVANLVLGRATARGRELALRVALGASRGRLVRQLMTESVVLTMAGGAVGLLFAAWGLGSIVSLGRESLFQGADIRLDGWALAFTFGIALITGVVFGLVPAGKLEGHELHETLKEGSGRTSASVSQGRLRHALVTFEVALSLILLVGAGLLIRSVGNLLRTDPGFDPTHMVSAEIWLTGSRYDSTAKIAGFYGSLTEQLRAIPGVQSAAVIESGLPLQRGGNLGVTIDGVVPPRAWTDYRSVTPSFFVAMGLAAKQGRTLTDGDAGSSMPVIVVNEAFVKQYFPDGAPLGHLVKLGGSSDVPRRVVGVVGDVRSHIGRPAMPGAFIPSAQTPAAFTRIYSSWFPIHVLVRTAGDPTASLATVERVIRGADSQVPVGRVRTMEDVLSASLAFQRFVMSLLSLFAGLAIVLAAVGIYGVIAYLVTQRTHEIGVRMALGARPSDVLGMVLRRGLFLSGLGSVIGLAGALALSRLLGSLLYDVRPTDVPTYAAVTALLIGIALLACWIPARRASKTDPIIALRSE